MQYFEMNLNVGTICFLLNIKKYLKLLWAVPHTVIMLCIV